MNNKLKFLVVGVSTFVIGLSVSGIAMSDTPSNFNVAVVDIQKVVGNSAQVKALKKEQQAKAEDIMKFVEGARKEVASVTDAGKKKALEEKYNKELNAKKEGLEKGYAAKLAKIDADITKTISEQAKSGNYNVVLTKGVVLYGGTDITESVAKAVK